MRLTLIFAVATFAVLFNGLVSGMAGTGKGPLRTLVDAERAFAKRSTDSTTRQAFAENLGPEAIVFRPGAINHHLWAESNPDWGTKGLLTWDPAFGRTSTSGDFGYTTGPAEFRTARDMMSEPVWHGFFVSVWARKAGGPWRVLLDTGTTTPKPEHPTARFEPVPAMERLPVPALADAKAGLEKLKLAEEKFAASAAQDGQTTAYRAALAESGRVHRDEYLPMIGREPGVTVLDARRKSVSWNVVETMVASSADLGFAYGNGEARLVDGSIAKFAFVRIWELDSKRSWKIVLDVETAIPVEISTASGNERVALDAIVSRQRTDE